MCNARLVEPLGKQCRKCQADISLLAHYVETLRDGLRQAEGFTRAGELDEAVWAYLAVLEVDPDNATARRQVGKVATAVRQFDQSAPGRRWLKSLQKQKRFTRWMARWNEGESGGLLSWVVLFVLFFGAVVGAYYLGYQAGKQAADNPTEAAARVR
jgi:hypothetical protein